MQETKTVSRGVLWLVVCLSGFIILALTSVSASTISNWALMVDKRGLENMARITALENKYSSIEAKLDSIQELLRSHMNQDKR